MPKVERFRVYGLGFRVLESVLTMGIEGSGVDKEETPA